jgi:repressor of nif and glnA expression
MMVDFLGATSNGTIQYRIKRLEQKRYIKNLGYRGIKILKEGSDK